ncbi:hypothetical protein WJX81_003267 [Elliptochloris bilobata]|uniref:U-box domain-containing protein n=1 Tax=Elliptochloris bilobata TaxID=381761 RepID=A0AAW1RH62_9CHLO
MPQETSTQSLQADVAAEWLVRVHFKKAERTAYGEGGAGTHDFSKEALRKAAATLERKGAAGLYGIGTGAERASARAAGGGAGVVTAADFAENGQTGGMSVLAHRAALVRCFACPLTGELPADPVIAADANTYERSAIEAHMASGDLRSPLAPEVMLAVVPLRPNVAAKEMIERLQALLAEA